MNVVLLESETILPRKRDLRKQALLSRKISFPPKYGSDNAFDIKIQKNQFSLQKHQGKETRG